MTNSAQRKIDYKENLAVALKVFEEIIMDSETLNTKLKEIDKEQQDILHIIENLAFNGSQGYSLAKRLKEVRNERREIKEQIEQYNEVKGAIDLYRKTIKPTVYASLQKVEHLQKLAPIRTYVIRKAHDLEAFNDLANRQRKVGKYKAV